MTLARLADAKKRAAKATTPLEQSKLLKDVDITRPPYLERYPGLKDFMAFAGEPRRNHASANLIMNCKAVQTGNWDVTDSCVTATDPGFVNAAKLDFQLRDDAVVVAKIPGFEKIPFAQIGLQRDEFRRRLVKGVRE